MTSKQAILERLKYNGWLAIHEFKLIGWSENNVATRLSELTREGKLECRFRKGENFKEWKLKDPSITIMTAPEREGLTTNVPVVNQPLAAPPRFEGEQAVMW